MTRAQTEAIAELAAALQKAHTRSCVLVPQRSAAIAFDLHRLGLRALRLFELNCNVGLDEKVYYRRLERITKAVKEASKGVLTYVGDRVNDGRVCELEFDWQTDPRGWPLIVCVDGREYRVGGR